ncbi:phosphodiester glycosidase family protein [Sphingosinicella sp. BN140058]|uniref:phosphodiester glycosidase family protein n=1 Tax=Sphingosinicella sp. BN140058 TaxID=1892855 RepID=UPI001013494E|nr:phosphodiester glycosidase family protein [Sphingosinicella sp. BN140058]QAY78423.1 hypothetical protein ETR14_19180 [Sphingosinicella sp. BN140058]
MAAIRCSAILAALLAAGCNADPPEAGGEAANAFDPASLIAPAACESRRFEGTHFTICPFDTGKDRIEIAVHGTDGQPLRSFSALGDALGADARANLRFAINGGMYDEDGEPIGLFVDRGRIVKPLNLRRGYGNFHLLPNGVFAVDAAGRVSVTPSSRFARAVPKPFWATQSGPMLVIDGKLHPGFDSDGESRLVRNGVGVASDRRGYFAISEEGVSFGRFARLFRDALGCRNALFLDGSVSSLWDPAAGRKDPYAALGPLILVSRRKD